MEELQESTEPIDFTEIKEMIRRRRWQFLVPFTAMCPFER